MVGEYGPRIRPHHSFLSFSQTTRFRLKKFEDDNSKFDINCRTLFKRVENTVEKGEISRHIKTMICLEKGLGNSLVFFSMFF